MLIGTRLKEVYHVLNAYIILDNSANNKRIAKNTVLLYFRTIFVMLVALYTSRVVLQVLGVDDYGIYNVVGGLVSMFTIISGSLSAAITRFITFSLGKDNMNKLSRVFATSIHIQIMLFLLLAIIAETIGLWFLNYEMIIPSDRLKAANICFQLSILTFGLNLWSIPYNALIIAHEKMTAFAIFGIADVVSKLVIALLIVFSSYDKLVIYASLMLISAFLMRFVYMIYCTRNFKESHYHFCLDRTLLKEMFSFAGWNFFGAASGQLMVQGVNLVVNTFFGVAVNAARGIATQVENAVVQFVNNFATALNPQITKKYAKGDMDYMLNMVNMGARYTYYMFLFIAVPIFFEANQLLSIWLHNVPEYTISFVRLTLILSLIGSLSNTMVTAMLATGKIKKYQLIVGGLGMLVLPISWICFKLGMKAETAYIVNIIIYVFQLIARLVLMRQMIGLSIRDFFKDVIFRAILITISSLIIPNIIVAYFSPSLLRMFSLFVVWLIIEPFIMYIIGLNKQEKNLVKVYINKIIRNNGF